MYIDSNNIKVFPFGKYRSKIDATASNRLLYETNIANILGKLIDTEGFVKGSITADGKTNGELIINIAGYYFIISSGVSLVTGTSGNVYASIKLTGDIPALDGQDTEGEFQGLSLTDSLPGDNFHYILLMVKDGDNWTLNPDVYKKFDSTSINITEIDGKLT